MRVIFVGASSFGLRCLEVINGLPGVDVVGVITNPKTFNISYGGDKPVTNVLHADFVAWASDHSLPCIEMTGSMKDERLHAWVRALTPQLFVVAGWYHMVPKSLREIAPAIGLHASLLPDYSGGAPLVWAMINGETRTGITLFKMDDGVDSGPIIGQAEVRILPVDTISTLYERIEQHGLRLLRDALPKLADGTAEFVLQDESKRRIFPQRSPKDGRIDWTQDAVSIDRFIRAQTRPYPGAYTTLDGESLTIWSASRSVESLGLPPGTVLCDGAVYQVSCGSGSIVLGSLQYRNQDIAGAQLADLFGPGGQKLGG